MPRDYVTKILKARVYEVARETPLELAPKLSSRLGSEVWLKREDLQPVFSFKIRGAYNKLASLTGEERARGVIASSAGNHAQGVALAAVDRQAVGPFHVDDPTCEPAAVHRRQPVGGVVVALFVAVHGRSCERQVSRVFGELPPGRSVGLAEPAVVRLGPGDDVLDVGLRVGVEALAGVRAIDAA